MSRSTVHFILDIILLFNLIGLAFTGIIMRYILPPGTGGLGRAAHGGGGRGVHIKELWSMTRHQWGSVHFWLSTAFIVLMLIHIILHWSWIKTKIKSMVSKQKMNEKERMV